MVVEFNEPLDVQNWLFERQRAGAPKEAALAVAARAALRALPATAEVGAELANKLLLPACRACLIASVSVSGLRKDLVAPAQSAARFVPHLRRESNFRTEAAYDAASAAHSVAAAVTHSNESSGAANALQTLTAFHLNVAKAIAASAASVPGETAFLNSARDAMLLETRDDPMELFETPLWQDEFHARQRSTRERLQELWMEDPKTWKFWQRWYESLEAGTPSDWWSQERIIHRVRDADWNDGPRQVAWKIKEIEARFALERCIAEAEPHLVQSSGNRLGIGANNPPEPISPELSVIWEPLRELSEQTREEQPSKSVIQRSISRLIGALVACGKWTGGHFDSAAREYAKALGKWSAGLTSVWLATLIPKVEAIIEAARLWLNSLF